MRHPIQLPNYMCCLMKFYESLSKMSFKNLKKFPEQSTLHCIAIFIIHYIFLFV
jgi:hypothetical protein